MLRAPTLVLCLSLLTLAACDAPSREYVELKGGLGTLRFVDEKDGGQSVQLCRDGGCRRAPDNEYKTDRGRTIPVTNGRLKYEEKPHQVCKFDIVNDRHVVNCKDKK